MAKTIIKGAWYNTSTVTLYTVPSNKYAKVTVLYYGMESPGWNSTSQRSNLYINAVNVSASSQGKFAIISGNLPYMGVYNNTAVSISRGLVQNDGTFLMPPSSYLQSDSGQYAWTQVYFLIEEIDATTIEA
jgi:hypothetical protein